MPVIYCVREARPRPTLPATEGHRILGGCTRGSAPYEQPGHVISDAHPGLVAAVEATLLGAAWQRCRVHATRNALGLVAKAAQGMVAGAIRSIFEEPDEASARAQLVRVVDGLAPRFPKVAELLERAEDDLLACFRFPKDPLLHHELGLDPGQGQGRQR